MRNGLGPITVMYVSEMLEQDEAACFTTLGIIQRALNKAGARPDLRAQEHALVKEVNRLRRLRNDTRLSQAVVTVTAGGTA